MKKKILSMALACALVLSASQTVGAAGDTTIDAPDATTKAYEAKVEATTDVTVPTINITLSDTSSKQVGINPYGLEYTINGISEKQKDAIPNREETITNNSNVPIEVNVTTQAEVSQNSEAVIASSTLKGTETTKSVFAYLQIKAKDSNSAALTTTPAYNTKDDTLIAFGTKATTKKAMLTLKAKEGSTASYAGYKIFGQVAEKPAKAWATTDTLKYTIIFQFQPVAIKAASGS